jgi:hypothetical protein
MERRDFDGQAVDLEDAFFARENARLLADLRRKAEKDERREMLRRVVQIDDEAFLDRLIAIGIGPETALALRLIPLVFVAWADGEVDPREREAILRGAEQQELASEGAPRQLLESWLAHKPDPRLLALWKSYVGDIWPRFTADERWKMRQNLLESARQVAEAAGGFLGVARISAAERQVLEDLERVVA